MKTIDIISIKRKFGQLLSTSILQYGINVDVLNSKIINSPYFDFMETNEINRFLKDNNSDICFNVFGAKQNNYSDDYRNDLMYAGESYISISISLSIPLRKLFLLFPLSEMLELYQVYHEMNPFRIIEEVKNRIEHKSSFKILLDNSSYSINQLAKLIQCDRRTLMELYNSPKQEKKLPYEKVKLLSRALSISECFFSRSFFVPYFSSLWKSEEFISTMKNNISIISSLEVMLPRDDISNKKNYILLDYSALYIFRNGKKVRQIYPSTFDELLSLSIEQYKEYCYQNRVAFC